MVTVSVPADTQRKETTATKTVFPAGLMMGPPADWLNTIEGKDINGNSEILLTIVK